MAIATNGTLVRLVDTLQPPPSSLRAPLGDAYCEGGAGSPAPLGGTTSSAYTVPVASPWKTNGAFGHSGPSASASICAALHFAGVIFQTASVAASARRRSLPSTTHVTPSSPWTASGDATIAAPVGSAST